MIEVCFFISSIESVLVLESKVTEREGGLKFAPSARESIGDGWLPP